MPKVERPDGTQVHFETSGEGPPLLLLAGFMSDGASWGPILPLLQDKFTLVRPDNRSCGQTTPWNAPCSPRLWAEDALAVLDVLGLERSHVVGHSLGGIIGWQFAHMASERTQSLLIAGTALRVFPRNTSLWRSFVDVRRSDADPATWLRLLFPWLFHADFFENPDLVEKTIAASLAYRHGQSCDAMEHQLSSLQGENDPTPFAAPPDVPLRALLAEEDLLIPAGPARETLSGVDTRIFPNAAHSMHWDRPHAFAEEILSFIEEVTDA